MRVRHVDRSKRRRQMRSAMKGSCLLAVFMTAAFMTCPRLLAAQDAPTDLSTVAATIDAAEADLENNQATAKAQRDKTDGTADDSSQAEPDATADASSSPSEGQTPGESPSESANGTANPASAQLSSKADDAQKPSPALDPAPVSANGTASGNPQPAVNAQNVSQASSAAAAPASPAGSVTPSGPKSEIALASANLMKLANDLKSEVDKTTKDTLSVTVVREADQIEQLARKMRTK